MRRQCGRWVGLTSNPTLLLPREGSPENPGPELWKGLVWIEVGCLGPPCMTSDTAPGFPVIIDAEVGAPPRIRQARPEPPPSTVQYACAWAEQLERAKDDDRNPF